MHSSRKSLSAPAMETPKEQHNISIRNSVSTPACFSGAQGQAKPNLPRRISQDFDLKTDSSICSTCNRALALFISASLFIMLALPKEYTGSLQLKMEWGFTAKVAGLMYCILLLTSFLKTYAMAKEGAMKQRDGYTYNWPFAGVPSDTFCPQYSPNYWVGVFAISGCAILLATSFVGKYFTMQEAMKIKESSDSARFMNQLSLAVGLFSSLLLCGVGIWTIDLEPNRSKHQFCTLGGFGGATLYVILINITYYQAGLTPFLAIRTVSLVNGAIATLALASFLFTDNMVTRLGKRANMDRECPTNIFWVTAFNFSELGYIFFIALQLGLILPNELNLSALS